MLTTCSLPPSAPSLGVLRSHEKHIPSSSRDFSAQPRLTRLDIPEMFKWEEREKQQHFFKPTLYIVHKQKLAQIQLKNIYIYVYTYIHIYLQNHLKYFKCYGMKNSLLQSRCKPLCQMLCIPGGAAEQSHNQAHGQYQPRAPDSLAAHCTAAT